MATQFNVTAVVLDGYTDLSQVPQNLVIPATGSTDIICFIYYGNSDGYTLADGDELVMTIETTAVHTPLLYATVTATNDLAFGTFTLGSDIIAGLKDQYEYRVTLNGDQIIPLSQLLYQ